MQKNMFWTNFEKNLRIKLPLKKGKKLMHLFKSLVSSKGKNQRKFHKRLQSNENQYTIKFMKAWKSKREGRACAIFTSSNVES
jgi:hypothetical protein